MNFARDVVEAAPPERLAIVELARDGARREWRFGEVAEQAGLLHAHLGALGARRGDVVLDAARQPRPSGCWRWSPASAPATPCCRAPSSCAPKDLRLRLDVTGAALVSPTSATATRSRRRAGTARRVWAPWGELPARDVPPPAELDAARPVPGRVHLRHLGRAEGGAARPGLPARPAPAGRALARRAGRATSSGARPPRAGRSRRATRSSRRGCAAPRRCCTTPASTPPSGSRSPSARA